MSDKILYLFPRTEAAPVPSAPRYEAPRPAYWMQSALATRLGPLPAMPWSRRTADAARRAGQSQIG